MWAWIGIGLMIAAVAMVVGWVPFAVLGAGFLVYCAATANA